MAHNKYLRLLLFEDNDSISAKSAAQILYTNLAQNFLLLNFELLVYVILQLFVHLHLFLMLFSYQKTCRPHLLMLFGIYHIHNSQQFHNLCLSECYLKQLFFLNLYYQNVLYHEQKKRCLFHFYINVLITRFCKFMNSFTMFSKWSSSNISKSWLLKSNSGINLSPVNKNFLMLLFILN